MSRYNSENIATAFPFLKKASKGVIYFDNAATTQKPATVIDSISNFYKQENSNKYRIFIW